MDVHCLTCRSTNWNQSETKHRYWILNLPKK